MPVNYDVEATLAYLRWMADEDEAEEAWLRTLRDYMEGDHTIYLTDRQKEYIGLDSKDLDYPFSHNDCRLVVDAVVERLHVMGFSPKGGAVEELEVEERAVSQAFVDLAMDWWEQNRMDARQDELYQGAVRDGEGYIIVDWYDDRPRWTVNDKYDGSTGVKAHRNPDTGEIEFASKRWVTFDALNPEMSGRVRVTLYFADRIEKYIDRREDEPTDEEIDDALMALKWQTFRDTEDEPWPIPWTEGKDGDGEPLGIPVIPFVNPGGSELADMIPLQDMLNKADLDLAAAADTAGFQVLWATGVSAEIDATTGAELEITIAPARLMRLSSPESRVGALPPADLSGMIEISDYWTRAIASVTRTPHYLFQARGTTPASGESLKWQEVGLDAKCRRKQAVFGNAFEDTLYLSGKLWNKYREGVEVIRLEGQWRPILVRSEQEAIEVGKGKRALEIPLRQVWRELGYNDRQITQLMAERRMEKAEAVATRAQALAEQARAFDQGLQT